MLTLEEALQEARQQEEKFFVILELKLGSGESLYRNKEVTFTKSQINLQKPQWERELYDRETSDVKSVKVHVFKTFAEWEKQAKIIRKVQKGFADHIKSEVYFNPY